MDGVCSVRFSLITMPFSWPLATSLPTFPQAARPGTGGPMYLEDSDLIGLECGPSTSSSNLLRDTTVQPGGTGAQCEQAWPAPGG